MNLTKCKGRTVHLKSGIRVRLRLPGQTVSILAREKEFRDIKIGLESKNRLHASGHGITGHSSVFSSPFQFFQ